MMGHNIEQLINAYLDETLAPEQGAALNAWVKQDPANARRFAKAAWLHRQVYDRLHLQDLQQIQDEQEDYGDAAEVDYGDVLQQLLVIEQAAGDSGMVDLTEEMSRRERESERKRSAAKRAAAARRLALTQSPEIARVIVIPKLLVYGVAAMVALSVLTALYAGWMTGRHNATPPVAQTPEQDTQSLPPIVAELVSSEGLVWGDRALSSRPGTSLRRGALVLERGIAEVRFQSGAVATFRAPAVIDLRGDNRMALIQGAMVAEVPEAAYGFTVDTPTMRVVDLGTEFGITADAVGDSAVQVFAGEVTAAAFDNQGHLGVADSIKSRAGLAIDAGTRATRPIPVDGRAFEDLAPHVALLYRNLVVNGDFEQGEPGAIAGESIQDTENIQVPGWVDHAPGTVLGYDAAATFDYPNARDHRLPESKGRGFYAGLTAGRISQQIDVSALAGLIDTGDVRFDLSAWLGGFEEHDEYIALRVRFLDADGSPVASEAALDPVRPADRGGVSGFLPRDRRGTLPAGTRRVEIEMQTIGSDQPPYVQDAYADNVALVLSVD